MPFSIKLWHVNGKELKEVPKTALDDEARLETWVANDPSVLGMDVLLIGRQVSTPSGGRVDLLAIDSEANTVVLELKRDKTPREIVAQTIDYASWVKDLAYDELNQIAVGLRGKSLREMYAEHFG